VFEHKLGVEEYLDLGDRKCRVMKINEEIA
jgi:hypothetical protein